MKGIDGTHSSTRGRCLFVVVALVLYLSSARAALGATGPCAERPETRQLDYWLGHWATAGADGAAANTSSVSMSLEKCLFIEHWQNGKGHESEKMFAYDAEAKNWTGMFADNEGRVHIFVDGKVSSGTAEFHGPSRGPNGEEVLNRLRVARVAADKIEETWEKSTDNGQTWSRVYRAEYSRATP
jgi:hypothetical protein